MPAATVLRPRSRPLITAATVPLALAALLADVRVRRQLDAARKDPLTGLPGRDALMDRTERLARTHREQPCPTPAGSTANAKPPSGTYAPDATCASGAPKPRPDAS
ncbi:hypothetical protein [Streptomyces mirabilis]|uniref:hypothetical protein n=1 Tax=Streptomyces mirabilis TaxID=68239 RepID=UPI00340FBC41